MPNVDRVRVALTGFPGGPGVATYYGRGGPALFPSVHQLWLVLASQMPSDVTVTFENFGDSMNDSDGALVGSWSIAAVAPVQGTNSGGYAAPVGACLTWLTDTIADRHRLRGRTFVVPLPNAAFQSNGTLEDTMLATLRGAASEFVTNAANVGVIWHRPRAARAATPTRPAVTQRSGSSAFITGSRVVDKAAVLRSRRD